MDSLGSIYGTTEGLESAIRVLIDVTPDSLGGWTGWPARDGPAARGSLLTLIVALTATADTAEAEGPVPVQDSTTATEATGVGFANQPLPHSQSPHELTLSSWDGLEPTLALRALTEAGWDPVAWVVAGLDEAFQHTSVTTLAAPAAAASAATDPEAPSPRPRPGSPRPGLAARWKPTVPAGRLKSRIPASTPRPKAPAQPLALSESSLFSPQTATSSGQIWDQGRVFGLVVAGTAATSWLLSDRVRSSVRTNSVARLLSSRLPLFPTASRRTKTLSSG